MDPRASSLIEILGLAPHPEGGFFREVFRSSSLVTVHSSGARRCAITSIYYLLAAGQVSKFHRVSSDEVWHFLEGDPLTLYMLDPDFVQLEMRLLGPVSELAQPVHVVPANYWQAALPAGAFTLSGCAVGPGFEYEDFTLLSGDPAALEKARLRFPDLDKLFQT